MTLEERIEAYLDGELDNRAAAEVEAALVDPAVAELLSEELMLRELLASMPPEAPPDELIARLEDSLGVGTGFTAEVKSQLRAVFAGSGRAVSGSALAAKALVAARMSLAGARLAASGVSTMRTSLNLVAEVADMPLLGRSPSKPKPLWRRAASYLWRRRK